MSCFLPVSLLFLWGCGNDDKITREDPLTITYSQSDALGKLRVNYNGRIAPLHTVAGDFTVKLTGNYSFGNLSPVQFMFGWVVYPEQWQEIKLIEVKSKALRDSLGLMDRYVSLSELFSGSNEYLLLPFLEKIAEKTSTGDAFQKEILGLNEKVNLIYMAESGALFKIFPNRQPRGVLWLSPADELPAGMSGNDTIVIKAMLPTFVELERAGRYQEAEGIIDILSQYQKVSGKNILPPEWKNDAEIFLNKLNLFSVLFYITISIGIIGLIIFIILLYRGENVRWFLFLIQIFQYLLFIILTAGIVIRSLISGFLPLSNGFEAMLILAWLSLLTGLILGYRNGIFSVFAVFLSGLSLLVAHLGGTDPQITPLAPVLKSVWLNIHVIIMMLAYTLAAFIAVAGFLSLTIILLMNDSNIEKSKLQVENLSQLIKVMLYPCVFLLGAGIFTGAVWANNSWGRYWGWDPKETWALITFIAYSVLFHERSLNFLKNRFVWNTLAFLLILLVIMTYFGVNYLLGGIHSYGGEFSGGMLWAVFLPLPVITGMIILAWHRFKKYYYQD